MADPASDELAGAVAIVTGAAGGVGRATVELLTARGARVVAEDLNPAVGDLESEQVAALRGDVAESDTARRAVALALARFGSLNVIVNNAGRFLLGPTVDTTDDEWDELLRVNVRGAFLHCREALPALTEHGDGRIVNVASISGAIDTGFTDEAMAGVRDREAQQASIAAAHPLGRMARAEEIAEVIAFLASPRSSIITGAILMADGGFTAQ
jgi:NAD(P)-dependent dehydrogenase (short-subunit alcohol dehydrogenase family)